jgi:outer membrane lipoprotein-sorting protein
MRAASPILLCLSVLPLVARPAGGQPTAREIVSRADSLTRGDTQQGRYEMRIVRPDWERSTTFEFWSEGTEKAFIRVVEPARDRGVGFLKVGREMWNYIPRVNRVIKIPPSMMLQSWMGSDFTNDDLVKESSVVDDYEHTLIGSDTLRGAAAWHVELVPKEGTAVAWDRIQEWIRKEDYVPLKAVYFNERGEITRTMLFTEIRRMGGRLLPTRYDLIEETRPGRRTVLILEDVAFDRPVDERVFSQQNLRRGS